MRWRVFVYEPVRIYKDWYNNRGNKWEYSNSTCVKTVFTQVWVPSNIGGAPRPAQNYHEHIDAPAPHAPGGTGHASNHPKEIILDKSVTPCVKEIIRKLQEKDLHNATVPDISQLTGTSHLSQTILDLFKKSKNYHLTFKIGEAGTNKNAYTEIESNRNGEFYFIVTLDEEFVENGTQLVIARTLIHESMHAFLGYVSQEHFLSDSAKLLSEYNSTYGNRNTADHVFMTEYVEAIGYSLASWDDHSRDKEYYNNLAWSGEMLNTEAYRKLADSTKTKIKNVNIAEGNANTKATSNALGIKCKSL